VRKDFSFDQMRHTPGFALTGLFVLASLYTLYFARAILLPVVLALLLSWSLAPIVHALKTLRLPAHWGASTRLNTFKAIERRNKHDYRKTT
jgi:predicted PurR-regulated permease PerM